MLVSHLLTMFPTLVNSFCSLVQLIIFPNILDFHPCFAKPTISFQPLTRVTRLSRTRIAARVNCYELLRMLGLFGNLKQLKSQEPGHCQSLAILVFASCITSFICRRVLAGFFFVMPWMRCLQLTSSGQITSFLTIPRLKHMGHPRKGIHVVHEVVR